MLTKKKVKKSVWFVFVCLSCFFSASSVYAGRIAEIHYADTMITMIPDSGLANISIEISVSGEPVYQKKMSSGIEKIQVSGFTSIKDERYRLLLKAETGDVSETMGKAENGREPKKYYLKKTIEQVDGFTIAEGKILDPNAKED